MLTRIKTKVEERKVWWGTHCAATSHAIYNNGKNLYFDPRFSPPFVWYDYQWQHMPYREYSPVFGKKMGSIRVFIQGHCGPCQDAFAGILVGDEVRWCCIPMAHILYVVVGSNSWSTRLELLPLPMRLVPRI